ncbi:ubiquitin carboxyl-terminal hydrolase 16-like [Panicum miliaceum]|uniref:Ubiquitin carboxyl-terminal hydrolase 16-like n=1 Tax=Panicum miliaceum TaxID=4540 RepID=A0A3L6RK32_PANMI|nr:ubiquitin carboxyl-terminal hydrolase 16-like [Panicum miliaceum]
MEEEEAGSPSAAAVVLALVALVVVPGLALLARSRWRRAAARREDARRLARLAAEESELAERESVLAYYSELFPGVVHAAEVPEAPVWGPTPVAAPAQEDVEAQPQPQPPAGARGVCAVCFRPTTFRCKQCKAVKYCSFKCQIAHWRQGHKDECHPPKPLDEGKVEQERAAEENVSTGVKPVAVGSETSDANHSLKSLNGDGKHMHLEDVCTSTEVPGGHQSNGTVQISQNVPVSVDSSKMASNTEHANFVEDSPSSKGFNEELPCKSQTTAPNVSGQSSSFNEKSFNHSKEHHKARNASVVEDFSQASHNRKLEDSSNLGAAASAALEPKSSRTPISVELERSKTKLVPSALTVDKATSIHGGCSVIPIPSKVADNRSDRSFKPSERPGSTTNNLVTTLKKIVSKQTAPKVVRHYPSESTTFFWVRVASDPHDSDKLSWS